MTRGERIVQEWRDSPMSDKPIWQPLIDAIDAALKAHEDLVAALRGLRSVHCWCPCGPTELGAHDAACQRAQMALQKAEKE